MFAFAGGKVKQLITIIALPHQARGLLSQISLLTDILSVRRRSGGACLDRLRRPRFRGKGLKLAWRVLKSVDKCVFPQEVRF